MLSKNDLSQIGTIVRNEIRPLESGLGKVETKLGSVETRLTKVEKGQIKIQKDLDTTIRLFDNDYVKLRKRVDKLEDAVFA